MTEIKPWQDRVKPGAFTGVKMEAMLAEIAELRAALAKSQPAEQGEPVAWQYRTRPDWEKDWQQGWMYCSKGAFEDYTRAPLLHDWHYEVRELFTHPVRPMSEAQIIQWMPVGLLRTEEFVYQKGIKDAEKFHGIKGATE